MLFVSIAKYGMGELVCLSDPKSRLPLSPLKAPGVHSWGMHVSDTPRSTHLCISLIQTFSLSLPFQQINQFLSTLSSSLVFFLSLSLSVL